MNRVKELEGLLREARDTIDTLPGYPIGADLCDRIEAALSQQAEPVEPAPAQDVLDACGSMLLTGEICAQPQGHDGPCGPAEWSAPAQDEREARALFEEMALIADDEQCIQILAAALATRPAQTERQPVEVMLFQLKHPETGDAHTVALTRSDIADGMDDTLFEKLGDLICDCQPAGETNVVDCNCDDYIYEFELVNAAPIAQTDPQPEPGLLERIDAAIKAFTSGKASMHVPPEPTDVDMVLGECWQLVKRLSSAPQPEQSGLAALSAALAEYDALPKRSGHAPATRAESDAVGKVFRAARDALAAQGGAE